jgi:hypothetical protein
MPINFSLTKVTIIAVIKMPEAFHSGAGNFRIFAIVYNFNTTILQLGFSQTNKSG